MEECFWGFWHKIGTKPDFSWPGKPYGNHHSGSFPIKYNFNICFEVTKDGDFEMQNVRRGHPAEGNGVDFTLFDSKVYESEKDKGFPLTTLVD